MTEIFAFSLRNASRPRVTVAPNGLRRGAGDAWSVAQFPDKASCIVKQVGHVSPDESCLENFLELNPHAASRSFMFQASASRNKRIPMNIGPFQRMLNGHDYAVSFQGMPHTRLINGDNGNHNMFVPVGESHQEDASCRLLSALAKREVTAWSHDDYGWLRSYLRRASRSRSFNTILSDGERTFAYHGGDGTPLAFRRMNGNPEVECKLMKVDWVHDARPRGGYVIATSQAADGPGWQRFEPGELIVFQNGNIVFFDTDRPTP